MQRRRRTDRVSGIPLAPGIRAHWHWPSSSHNWSRMRIAAARSLSSTTLSQAWTVFGAITPFTRLLSVARCVRRLSYFRTSRGFSSFSGTGCRLRSGRRFSSRGWERKTQPLWNGTLKKPCRKRYMLTDIDILQRFFSLGEGEQRDVIQKIRPILEAYCRNLYPTQFTDQDTLGVIVGRIRAVGAGHPLSPIVDHLDELNMYCRRYHHGENPNAYGHRANRRYRAPGLRETHAWTGGVFALRLVVPRDRGRA